MKVDKSLIWDAFLATEKDDFLKSMGYGVNEINKIGINKFIKCMGWIDPNQVKSWRTDKIHIMPCPHCNNEFVVYVLDVLCKHCKKHYDMNKIELAKGNTQGFLMAFKAFPDYRYMYQVRTLAQYVQDAIKTNMNSMVINVALNKHGIEVFNAILDSNLPKTDKFNKLVLNLKDELVRITSDGTDVAVAWAQMCKKDINENI
ncbi:MAG: hypothetical protein RR420_01040 [Anaerovoracaceae bacterium]